MIYTRINIDFVKFYILGRCYDLRATFVGRCYDLLATFVGR